MEEIANRLALFHYEERHVKDYDPEDENKSGIEPGQLVSFLQEHGFAKKDIDYKSYDVPGEEFTFLVFLKKQSREPMSPGHPNIVNLLQSAVYDFVGKDPERCKIFLECCLPEETRSGHVVREKDLAEVINTALEACELTKRRCKLGDMSCMCETFRKRPETRPRKKEFRRAFDLQDYQCPSKKSKTE